MIYKGQQFKRAKSVVVIHIPNDPAPSYVKFGRPCKAGAKGAVATSYTWPNNNKLGKEGETVWAMPVKLTSHDRTNMAYGVDGKMYLACDGVCYTCKYGMPLRDYPFTILRGDEECWGERLLKNALKRIAALAEARNYDSVHDPAINQSDGDDWGKFGQFDLYSLQIRSNPDGNVIPFAVFGDAEFGYKLVATPLTGKKVKYTSPRYTRSAHEARGLRIEKRDVIYNAVLECGHLVAITKEQYENATHAKCYKCEEKKTC
jgi:hypothetical protein